MILWFFNVMVDYGIKTTEKGDSEEIKPCPFNRRAESYFQVRHSALKKRLISVFKGHLKPKTIGRCGHADVA